jgi:hypothetical protein
MSARRWWPHRLAVLALLTVLWPALLAGLGPVAAPGQAAGCSVTGADVTLASVTCGIDPAGLLSGTFTAPEVPVSWPAGRPGECRQDDGDQRCVFEIAITACARADPGRCASANFGLEIRASVTPVSPPPVIPVSPSGSPVSPPPVQVKSKVIAAGPLITLDPQAGGPGTPVTVAGSGFAVTGPPPTTPPPARPTATAPASPTPTRTGQVVPVSHSNLAGPGVGLIVVLAVLAAVYAVLRRRSRPHHPGTDGDQAGGNPAAGPAAQVYARVSDAQPRPLIRNTARGPAHTMRIEVHRPAAAPHIEGRTPDDDSSSEPMVRITRIPLRPG